MTGKPGPVYLDCPGDLLYQKIDEDQVDWSYAGRPILNARPLGDRAQVDALVARASASAKQPIIFSGSGVIWSRPGTRCSEFVEAGRHPVLHHPAGPRRGARRPSVLVPDHALDRLPRRRPDHRARHADELHHRPCRAAALRRQGQDRPHRHRPDGDRHRRRATSTSRILGDCKAVLRAAARRHARASQRRTATRPGARSWPTARRRSVQAPGGNKPPRRRHPSAAAVRGGHELRQARRHPGASTARRSSTTAASRCRPSRRATGSTPGRSAPWASACRSASAPRLAKPDKQVIVRARRRLVRPQRDGARHGACATSSRCWS